MTSLLGADLLKKPVRQHTRTTTTKKASKEKTKPQIKINIPPNAQTPLFANIAQVAATKHEVILNFAFVQPKTTQGTMVSTIALTPQRAINLKKVLGNLLQKHAKKEKAKEAKKIMGYPGSLMNA